MCECYTCRVLCPQRHEEAGVSDPTVDRIVAKMYGGDDEGSDPDYDNLANLLGIDMSDPVQALACHLVEGDTQYRRALVAMRKAKGITQTQVAERMGIKQPAVHQLERDDADPKMSTLRRYALAVGAQVHHYVLPALPTRDELRKIDWQTEDET